MYELVSYAQPLRVIGQALELLNLENFDVEPDGEDYLVRGNVEILSDPPSWESTLKQVWGLFPGRHSMDIAQVPIKPAATNRLDLRYQPKDLDRLELEGRAKRGGLEGTADVTRLSQRLRAIGAYLNQKRAQLVKISRNETSMVVQYETSSGQKHEEVLSVENLYDFWVAMYLKRANRNGFEFLPR